MPLYRVVVFVGLFFDAVVYTAWLKRRTPYAILIGGFADGMRCWRLGCWQLGITPWERCSRSACFSIPTHIMTFSMRHFDDYRAAGIPTFPAAHGFYATRAVIAISSLAAAVVIARVAATIGVRTGQMWLLAVLGAGLLALAILDVARPSPRASSRSSGTRPCICSARW